MNKNIIIAITAITGIISLTSFVSAASANTNILVNKISSKKMLISSSNNTKDLGTIIKDTVRCTCGGESCGNSFESHPNASIGGIIVYCSQICSCRKKVGFEYETEY